MGESRGWRKGDGNGGREEDEAKTPQDGKRETGKERARRERREDRATDKRTRGAVDGVRSRGRRRREGLCRPADRKASFAETDRWGILCLKTAENNPTGN